MKSDLYAHLIEIAFNLQQTGDTLDAEAAGWILATAKAARAMSRKRTPRSVKVRLRDTPGGEFSIPAERIKDAQ